MIQSIGPSTNPCKNYHHHGEYDHDDGQDNDDADDHDDGEDADNIFSPDVPSEKRVRRWAVSLENIIMDPLGVEVI